MGGYDPAETITPVPTLTRLLGHATTSLPAEHLRHLWASADAAITSPDTDDLTRVLNQDDLIVLAGRADLPADLVDVARNHPHPRVVARAHTNLNDDIADAWLTATRTNEHLGEWLDTRSHITRAAGEAIWRHEDDSLARQTLLRADTITIDPAALGLIAARLDPGPPFEQPARRALTVAATETIATYFAAVGTHQDRNVSVDVCAAFAANPNVDAGAVALLFQQLHAHRAHDALDWGGVLCRLATNPSTDTAAADFLHQLVNDDTTIAYQMFKAHIPDINITTIADPVRRTGHDPAPAPDTDTMNTCDTVSRLARTQPEFPWGQWAAVADRISRNEIAATHAHHHDTTPVVHADIIDATAARRSGWDPVGAAAIATYTITPDDTTVAVKHLTAAINQRHEDVADVFTYVLTGPTDWRVQRLIGACVTEPWWTDTLLLHIHTLDSTERLLPEDRARVANAVIAATSSFDTDQHAVFTKVAEAGGNLHDAVSAAAAL